MVPRLSGPTSIFGGVFFVSKSLFKNERQKKLKKIDNFDPKELELCQNIDISNVAYSFCNHTTSDNMKKKKIDHAAEI